MPKIRVVMVDDHTLFRQGLRMLLETQDDMEVVAYLSARDGVAWAIEQLDGEVDPDILAEVEELDTRLRAATDYLVHELDIYGDIWRDEPEEYWWWYLDGGKPDPGGIPSVEERHRLTMKMLAEEKEEYKPRADGGNAS